MGQEGQKRQGGQGGQGGTRIMCQEHNGTRIYTKADCRNSGYWSEELCSEEQALRGASRGAPRAGSEGPRSLPGSRCNTTLQYLPFKTKPSRSKVPCCNK